MASTRLVAWVVVALTACVAQQRTVAQEVSLAGVYLCAGAGPDGSPYEGLVEITQRAESYHVRWLFPQDGRVVVGIGVRKDDVLAVMYFGEDPGVVTYRIEEGTRLVGRWTTVAAQGHVFSETLTKAIGVELPPPPAAAPPAPRDDAPLPRGVIVL
jgi:hypothetical protein